MNDDIESYIKMFDKQNELLDEAGDLINSMSKDLNDICELDDKDEAKAAEIYKNFESKSSKCDSIYKELDDCNKNFED